jgi:hypothetical protein
MARVNILRKDVKDAATKIVVTDYNLPVGNIDATKDAVAALLKNDKYIFANPKGVQSQ